MKRLRAAVAFLALTCFAGAPLSAQTRPDSRPRLIVTTDINDPQIEPDDTQSIVRLLLYANDIQIEGIVAGTAFGHQTNPRADVIEERVRAYGAALPNLRRHAQGYPDAQALMSRVVTGSQVYGMDGVGARRDTAGSRLIIAAVDRPDPRPVWVSLWGGAADLAQALWTVRATRSPARLAAFVRKLRVYAISDQDDAGPWIRRNFPDLFWIGSIHAFAQFELAAWTGISSNIPGADPGVVSRSWLSQNIVGRGTLGAAYPLPRFIMEGDSPSFLYLVPNGLGDPEHPDWGSWGGRFGLVGAGDSLWTDNIDRVRGADGGWYSTRYAAVWRWRAAFQNDFAARMAWSATSDRNAANHAPTPVLNGVGGSDAVRIRACPGQPLRLSAVGTSDPDRQTLIYRWWRYQEVTPPWEPMSLTFSASDVPDVTVTVGAPRATSGRPHSPVTEAHVILEVTDSGTPALTRYRRAVIAVAADGAGCPASPVRPSR